MTTRLESEQGVLGKSGVVSWLVKARLTSIQEAVLRYLGMDNRPAKLRRERNPKTVPCNRIHRPDYYCWLCRGAGKVDVEYVTKTKGRPLNSLVTWAELSDAVDKAVDDGSYAEVLCRTTTPSRKGQWTCRYCDHP